MATANSNREPLRRRSPTLTFEHAVEIWKRHLLGESQHHIAQAFGVNQGRVSEILKERRHVGSRLAALGQNRPGAAKGNAKH
jgi:predicted XRE-type DNA-binding protein